jgi:hypothetical protein
MRSGSTTLCDTLRFNHRYRYQYLHLRIVRKCTAGDGRNSEHVHERPETPGAPARQDKEDHET